MDTFQDMGKGPRSKGMHIKDKHLLSSALKSVRRRSGTVEFSFFLALFPEGSCFHLHSIYGVITVTGTLSNSIVELRERDTISEKN